MLTIAPSLLPHGTYEFHSLKDEEWDRAQVFPTAIARNIEHCRTRATKSLEKCGLANIWYLCQRANVSFNDKNGVSHAVKKLGEDIPGETLVYLFAFLKSRGQSILEQY